MGGFVLWHLCLRQGREDALSNWWNTVGRTRNNLRGGALQYTAEYCNDPSGKDGGHIVRSISKVHPFARTVVVVVSVRPKRAVHCIPIASSASVRNLP